VTNLDRLNLSRLHKTVASFSQKTGNCFFGISTTLSEGLYTTEIIIWVVHRAGASPLPLISVDYGD
jgi:hypothetical protein